MTTRTVKDVLSRVLRGVDQETSMSIADDDDYNTAFEYLIDMIDEYSSRGYPLWGNKPSSINDSLGSADPFNFLVSNLVIDIADYFSYTPTISQMSKAKASSVVVINRTLQPRHFCGLNNPRGSGNSYIFGYFCPCDTNTLESTNGVNLIGGV